MGASFAELGNGVGLGVLIYHGLAFGPALALPPPFRLKHLLVIVSDLINEKNLIPNLVAKDRSLAYSSMLQVLLNNGFIKEDITTSCLEGLKAREAKMTTAMGGGFALPHATIPKLAKPCYLLARCPEGVECEAVDGKLVTLFFLILTPPDHSQEHLQTLATVAKFFNRRGIKSKILQAAGIPEILSIIRPS